MSGKDTVSEDLRKDAFCPDAIDILKRLSAAASGSVKADTKFDDLLGGFSLNDDGAGPGQMQRLQQGRTPERMNARDTHEAAVAVAARAEAGPAPEPAREEIVSNAEAAAASRVEAPVSGLQNMMKEVFTLPDAADVPHPESTGAMKEGSEGSQEFDLFRL